MTAQQKAEEYYIEGIDKVQTQFDILGILRKLQEIDEIKVRIEEIERQNISDDDELSFAKSLD